MFTMQVIPQVNQITDRYTNFFLIVEDHLTLIDTGLRGSIRGLVHFIRSLGRSPEEINLIILTHNHMDHFGGLAELRKLTRAEVAAPKNDFVIDDSPVPYPAGNCIRKLLQVSALSHLRRRFVLESKDVDILLEGGEIFPILGGLQVIPTPGHTAGSISLYASRKKLLIVGDALKKKQGMLRLPLITLTSDIQQAVSSIRRMSELDVDIILFGHGRPVTENAKAGLLRLSERVKV